jgi:nucleoside-diphosphate-sugar epimerase
MKVLVLGGAGFIGPRIMRRLVDLGHEISCMDINPNSPSIANIRNQIQVARGDITLMDDVVRVMMEVKPDRVLHLAYYLGDERDPHYAIRLNILGTDNCFEAARICGIKRVVYASSLAVYGLQKLHGERALTEDDVCLDTGVYGASKIYNERQAAWYNKAYGMKITGVRPVNITGPDKIHGSVDHVQCITLPAHGQAVQFPFRDTTRIIMHVEDVSEIFVRVTLAESTQYSIYNLGGETLSLGQLANLVRQYLPEAKITFQNEQGGKDLSMNYMMDNTRFTKEFKFTPVPFPQRVKEIINDVRRGAGLPLVG